MIINVFVSSTNDDILQVTIQTLAAILKNGDILGEFPHYFPNNAIIEAFQKDQLKSDVLIMLSVAAQNSKGFRFNFRGK